MLLESVAASQSLDPVNRVSYLESHFYMRNTLLRDSDFMSMAPRPRIARAFSRSGAGRSLFSHSGRRKSCKAIAEESLAEKSRRRVAASKS